MSAAKPHAISLAARAREDPHATRRSIGRLIGSMALVATSLGVDATAFRQHLDGWLDGKRVATSRSWRAVEDAQLIATLLWPPNTPPAMVPGRKDREAVRRRGELSFDVGISKWKLLLQPHELKAISDWLRQWRGPILYSLRATVMDNMVPKLLEKRLVSRAEVSMTLGRAVQQGLDKLLQGYGGSNAPPQRPVRVLDVVTTPCESTPLMLAARTKNVWLNRPDGSPGLFVRELGASNGQSEHSDLSSDWVEAIETLPGTEPALFTASNCSVLHAVALPSALNILPDAHPAAAWIQRLHECVSQARPGTSTEARAQSFLDFVPPLPLDFPRPETGGCRGLPMKKLFELAAEQRLPDMHRGGGEALHIVDYVGVFYHCGKACRAKTKDAPCPTTSPLSELYGDVASTLIYAWARPSVALLEQIVDDLFPEFDATTAWAPSHAPHGGRASYPGIKIYLPEWMAKLYPGLRRKLNKQGYTWGHMGQYMHTDQCDGASLGLLFTIGDFDGFEQTLLAYVTQIQCGHFTILVARYGLLAHAVRCGAGLRVCILVHLHADMVPTVQVEAVRTALDAAAASEMVTPGERELLEPFLHATSTIGRMENKGKKQAVELDQLNHAQVQGWRKEWLKPMVRAELEDLISKGHVGAAVRDKWVASAKENLIRWDLTQVGNAVPFETQLLGTLCDPVILAKMCADCGTADTPWQDRIRECAKRLRAEFPTDADLMRTGGLKRRSGKGDVEADDMAGPRAAVRALHLAASRKFIGF